MHRKAFTIIELLIVISIVVILVGLLMAGAKAVRQARIKSQSEAIVGAVANALAASLGEGKNLPIIPHPYACSDGTYTMKRGGIDPIRLDARFHGFREQVLGTESLSSTIPTEKLWSYYGAWNDFDGTRTVSPGGSPLLGGENVQWLTSGAITTVNADGRDRRQLRNDVIADNSLPIVFGAKRELLGILGVPNPNYHDYYICPGSDSDSTRNTSLGVSQITKAVNVGNFPNLNNSHIQSTATPAVWQEEQAEAVRSALESAWSELSKLGCIRDAGLGTPSTSYDGYRLISDQAYNSTYSKYQPGAVNRGGWKSVSLPGMAVYDAWDRELFISMSADKRIRVISAGKDGCIRVDPNATATTPVINTTIGRRFLITCDSWSDQSRFKGFGGDDKDGAYDNITQGVTIDDYLDRLTEAECNKWGLTE